jgi:hypothetical protein
MTKGELRKARKAAGTMNVDHENGQPIMVRERTRHEEYKHAVRMERWARRAYDRD